jgi:hypothetical protein
MMWGVAADSHDFTRSRPRHALNPRAYHAPGPTTGQHPREPRYEQLEVGRGEAIQGLTREVLIHRSLEVSPNGFITIISIIQGVALALLAQNTFPKPTVLVIAQSVTLLLVFVSVFYFYLTMSVLLRWAPSFVDCFLPFAIAGLEIPPAFFLGNPVAWSAWLAALWFFTAIGFWITIKWSPPSHFGRALDAHRTWHRLLAELRMSVVAGGVAVALCGVLASQFPGQRTMWGFAGTLTVLATVATVIGRIEIRASQIHARYGVNRPPFN